MSSLFFQIPNWIDALAMFAMGIVLIAVEVLDVVVSAFLVVVVAETLWACMVAYTRWLSGRGLLRLSWNV